MLMPLQEYVVSVRLAEVQQDLYDKYLLLRDGEVRSKGAQLFKDYQALMRIWTHPWVLKLDEIRQENKVSFGTVELGGFVAVCVRSVLLFKKRIGCGIFHENKACCGAVEGYRVFIIVCSRC